ncbi:hypothetical protein N0M98_15770 [Paenibacillus doosanensis]|uniref:Uncharacterized protein n=1 Tax=Paenibacillus konkukensis TaxID=2020716 RepID=A0ABY4RHX2_9BACL|nr:MULTISPECIES: hypothetical protein [Paenibacillus]MCS7461611.1 hypothetical protein [Paenibacillus doosanensis]UQZ82036.1 hypothetical protein SK3146_01193 [Paenibacillus konkukensis]
MQKTCQKIVRVQNGLITEIYDGLLYRDFQDNDSALKELLMDDVGLDFDSILHTYEELIQELATTFPHLRDFIGSRLPEGWLSWAEQTYQPVPALPAGSSSNRQP